MRFFRSVAYCVYVGMVYWGSPRRRTLQLGLTLGLRPSFFERILEGESCKGRVLPQQFGGWEMQGSPQTSPDPAVADPTNAAVLKEYRFTDLASSTYTRDDGRTLKIRAARFADASGAFGAYTFYLQPEMTKEQIGDQGASLGQRVLFYRGNVLVDAQFSKESAMSGAELRELAGALPRPNGNAGNLPTFIEFMPRRGYVCEHAEICDGTGGAGCAGAPGPGGPGGL